MTRRFALVFVALVAAACSAQAGATPATQTPPDPSLASVIPTASPSPLAPAGISRAEAVELARGHSSLSSFVSASPGLFRDLNINPRIGPGYPVKPEQFVWAVKFAGDLTICNPLGVCQSPRPGTTVVFLDYDTGDFLSTQTVSPAP